MPPARRRVDQVLSPTFIEELETLTLDEVRSRRDLAEAVEVEQSYVRRVLQGKLDLLRAERRVRAGEAPSLIESLPEVLADDGPRPQYGRLPRYFSPGEHPWGRREGDDLVTADILARLGDLSVTDILGYEASISELEHKVSDTRRQIHRVIDTLKAEITRRYAEGLASVDELLEESAD